MRQKMTTVEAVGSLMKGWRLRDGHCLCGGTAVRLLHITISLELGTSVATVPPARSNYVPHFPVLAIRSFNSHFLLGTSVAPSAMKFLNLINLPDLRVYFVCDSSTRLVSTCRNAGI